MRRLRDPDLLVAFGLMVLGLLCLSAIWLGSGASPWRVAAGLTLVLGLPGTAILGGAGLWERLSGPELAVAAPGVSIAATALASLALYVLGIRLTAHSWTLALLAVTVVSSWGMASVSRPWRLRRPRLSGALLLWAAPCAVLVAAAVVISFASWHAAQRRSRFAALWVAPVKAPGAVAVGVLNHEGARRQFELTLRRTGGAPMRRSIALAGGASATRSIAIPAGTGRLSVTLTEARHPAVVLRTVNLTLAPARRDAG